MRTNREAVGFVTQALDEIEDRIVALQRHHRLAGAVEFLLALVAV